MTFALGFWNIALAVTDYYQYDKITNIERVTPNNVTFPAITICNNHNYIKDLYINGQYVNSSNLNDWKVKIPTIKNFINWEYTHFYTGELNAYLDASKHLDYFNFPDLSDCVRFNGVTNKNIELFTANKTDDLFKISFDNSFNKTINTNISFKYTIVRKFLVFIADNYLNSFDKLDPYILERDNKYDIDVSKETVEIKLPEQYNQCKESFSVKQYHQSNCLDTCIYKEIRNKYNCSFLLSLYSFGGFKQCDNSISFYKKEFSKVCFKECPLESCYSEKYTSLINIYSTNGFTAFRFSFYDFNTLNITQIPKTDLFTFINNVGGGLGLFMGIAFPNIIEFIQFISEIFLIALSC